jgi:redox-sensitive bicupin YhaK (pirin superfamily)
MANPQSPPTVRLKIRSTMERDVARIEEALRFGADQQVTDKTIIIQPGRWATTDPFLALSEDWFKAPGGFAAHPHRGFETVTLVLEGQLEHRDNRGGHGVLGPGDVQWMTAGRGIIHSELPHGDEAVHSLQLWVNLPARAKLAEPHYQDLRGETAPLRRFRGGLARVYSGSSDNVIAETLNLYPVTMVVVDLDPGATFEQPLPSAHRAFALAQQGALQAGLAPTPVLEGQTVWFNPTNDIGTDVIRLTAAESPARLIFFSAPPIGEPVEADGPFVMNTRAEIAKAIADYEAGLFVT